jgi:hypothetical protein
MKYSASFIHYKTQSFLAENNTKNLKHLQMAKVAAVFSRFSIQIMYIKNNYFA